MADQRDPDAALHAATPGKYKPSSAAAAPAPAPANGNPGTILDTVEQLPDLIPPTPTRVDLAPPPSFGETYSASRRVGRADRTDFDEIMIRDGYEPLLGPLGLDGNQNPAAFSDLAQGAHGETMLQSSQILREQGRDFMGSMTNRATQERLIAERIRAKRAKDPNFMPGVPDTVEGLRTYFRENEKKKRLEAKQVTDRATGFGGFMANMGGSVVELAHDPFNLMTMPLGGPGKTIVSVAAREALINGVIVAVTQPVVAENRAELGEELTAGEAATNIATGALFGGALGGAMHGAGKVGGAAYDRLMPKIFEAMPDSVQRRWADKMKIGNVKLTDVLADMDNRELSAFSRTTIGLERMTPDERAAAAALERDQDVGESSPFTPGPAGDAKHTERLSDSISDLLENRRPRDPAPAVGERPPAATSTATARPQAPRTPAPRPSSSELEAAIADFKGYARSAESGRHGDAADNPLSSADGRYQFTDDTFRRYYKRIYGKDLGEKPPIEIKRDPDVQEKLMDALTRDNAAALIAMGERVTRGNLYMMHFLGSGDAGKVFRADPDVPIERILSPKVIESNPHLKGKSASQVVAWAHTKMREIKPTLSVPPRSAAGELAAAGEDPRIAELRDEALRLDDEIVGLTRMPDGSPVNLYTRNVRSSAIGVDAERFQFKSGGDEFGVTDRLKGVKEWDAGLAGRVTLWEDNAGKLWIADGHQRHGLARRISSESGADIGLDAMVLRERDGISAEDARVWAALKNIAEGTGSAVDAAKVLRDAGASALDRLPPKSPLVRDGASLSRLSDDAFGAVYNERIPADQAAVIGELLPNDPDKHIGMVDLLIKLDPANRAQARSIVRQAIAAGFHSEEQIDLFGSSSSVASLFAEKAKILERGLARLRKMRLVHKTAANEADELERKGSKIARTQSEKEAQANAEAIAIVDRLAYRAGPVADALTNAARELASGGRVGDAADRFVNAIRELDLRALEREAPADARGGDVADGVGREGDVAEASPSLFEEPSDQGQPSLIELEAATSRFSDPDGPAIEQQADSLVHDFMANLHLDDPIDHEAATFDATDDAMHAETIVQHVMDEIGVERGVELDSANAIDRIKIEGEVAKLLNETNNVEAAIKHVRKAIEKGRLPVTETPVKSIKPKPMPKSELVPEPEKTVKIWEKAGDFIDPAEAKARVESWKAEAKRIGQESPPPANHVILSLFDSSGQWSQPYRDMGYQVIQLDLNHGHDLLQDIAFVQNAIDELRAQGGHFAGVIAQPPCTTFAASGARWWEPRHNKPWLNAIRKMWGPFAAKEFASPVEYNQYLVMATQEYIARAKPDFFVIENPVGRIEEMAGLPKPLMAIQPHNFGDPYTKRTHLWGTFNTALETANVDPVEGSKMHKLRGRDEKDEGLRSLTPEGFAYAFALANRPGTGEALARPVLHGADEGVTKAVTLEPELAPVDPAPAVPANDPLPDLEPHLDDADKAAIAAAYDLPEYGAEASRRFVDDFTTAIAKGLEHVGEAVREIIRKVQRAVLAAAVVLNPAGLGEVPAAARADFSPASAVRLADLPEGAAGQMTAAAQITYRAMADRAKAQGKGFIIADKPGGRIHVFASDGSLLASSPALYGKAAGDVAGADVTPAGSFELEFGAYMKDGKPVADMGPVGYFKDRATGERVRSSYGMVGVHRVVLSHPEQNRLGRLASESAADNKISSGCINTSEATFVGAIAPNVDELNGGLIFVLPEDPANTAAMFPAEQMPAGQPSAPTHSQGGVPFAPAPRTGEAALPRRETEPGIQRRESVDFSPDADRIISAQKGADLEELIARAADNQAKLTDVGKTIEIAAGAKFVNPGAKNAERVRQKFATEGYADPGELKDLARGGFVVESKEQAQRVAELLMGNFEDVYDKGWRRVGGYYDRKLIVRFKNGGVAEIQLIPKQILDYKMGEGHALYERARDPNTPREEYDRLYKQMQETYDSLLAGSEFAASGKALANSSAESSVPSSGALRPSAGADLHSPPLNTDAVSGSVTTTARSSSSKNLMSSSSPIALDMGPIADPGKAARDRELIQLGAEAPMRPAGEQPTFGEIGLELFDKANQGELTFRLSDDGPEISAKDLMAELEADAKAIDTLRNCL